MKSLTYEELLVAPDKIKYLYIAGIYGHPVGLATVEDAMSAYPEYFAEEAEPTADSGKRLVAAVKSGRAFNGFHKDAGKIVHAVEPLPPTTGGDWFTKAECGAEPGRTGNGWTKVYRQVNCPKCLKKIIASMRQNL